MKRREFIAGVGAAMASPFGVSAQQQKVWRIGFLASGRLDQALPVFREQMAEQGYVEGKTFIMDILEAQGRYDLLSGPCERDHRQKPRCNRRGSHARYCCGTT